MHHHDCGDDDGDDDDHVAQYDDDGDHEWCLTFRVGLKVVLQCMLIITQTTQTNRRIA